jgi:hypothetical protein
MARVRLSSDDGGCRPREKGESAHHESCNNEPRSHRPSFPLAHVRQRPQSVECIVGLVVRRSIPQKRVFPGSGILERMTALFVTLAVLTGSLHGVVMRGPTAPVCRVGMPCNAPADGVVLVFTRDGRVAARVRIGPTGRYTVRLAAGAYLVRQATAPRIGFGIRPDRVRVVRGVSIRVDFFIDTGIR